MGGRGEGESGRGIFLGQQTDASLLTALGPIWYGGGMGSLSCLEGGEGGFVWVAVFYAWR